MKSHKKNKKGDKIKNKKNLGYGVLGLIILVSIVKGACPLLLSRRALSELQMHLDFAQHKVTIGKLGIIGKTVHMNSGGHYLLRLDQFESNQKTKHRIEGSEISIMQNRSIGSSDLLSQSLSFRDPDDGSGTRTTQLQNQQVVESVGGDVRGSGGDASNSGDTFVNSQERARERLSDPDCEAARVHEDTRDAANQRDGNSRGTTQETTGSTRGILSSSTCNSEGHQGNDSRSSNNCYGIGSRDEGSGGGVCHAWSASHTRTGSTQGQFKSVHDNEQDGQNRHEEQSDRKDTNIDIYKCSSNSCEGHRSGQASPTGAMGTDDYQFRQQAHGEDLPGGRVHGCSIHQVGSGESGLHITSSSRSGSLLRYGLGVSDDGKDANTRTSDEQNDSASLKLETEVRHEEAEQPRDDKAEIKASAANKVKFIHNACVKGKEFEDHFGQGTDSGVHRKMGRKERRAAIEG